MRVESFHGLVTPGSLVGGGMSRQLLFVHTQLPQLRGGVDGVCHGKVRRLGVSEWLRDEDILLFTVWKLVHGNSRVPSLIKRTLERVVWSPVGVANAL